MSSVSLSIITVNLNNKIGLETTIKSVLDQSYKDYELLIIDGGSTDGSADLIGKFKDNLAYWVSEEDEGIYQAMNKGIQQSKGTYCLFLNSGDWLVSNNVLEKVFAEKPAADMLIGRCRISQKGKLIYITNLPVNLTLKSFIGSTLPHQATFIKTALFDQFGPYEEKYRINADFAFWIRALIFGNCSTALLDIIVSDYNLDGISSTTQQNPDIHKEIPLILSEHFPERVLLDYQAWFTERQNQDTAYIDWVKSSYYRFGAVKFAYKLSRRLTKVFAYVRENKNQKGYPAE